MRTAEEILNAKFGGLSGNIITPIHPIQIKLIIAAMNEYAIEAVDNYSNFWEDAHAKLEERLRNEYESNLKIWEISHDEQRQKFITFLSYVQGYPVQYTPGLRAEIENMINYFSK